MLGDVREACAKAGLMIHFGKTKVLTNMPQELQKCTGHIVVQGQNIEVLAEDGYTAYLGRVLCCKDAEDVDIRSRMGKVSGKFATLRSELCGRHYKLKDRLKLFDSSVTQTALYSSGSWTMTVKRERLLRRTHRHMLRVMLGARRTSCNRDQR